MKNGSKININDMSEEHLRNALRMVLRNLEKLNQEHILPSNQKKVTCSISKRFQEEEIQEIQNEQEYYLDLDDQF
jgi:hypothetical protein